MKKAPQTNQSNPDYSGLSAEELLTILTERDAQLEQVVVERDKTISNQQRVIKLLEEQLRLATIRKFATSSEKLPF
ncbi:MAG: IS66 family transposase, partial [Pseudomonadota bacterium]|nr:IS66 family transposase [Pseudomonadota bacterium]